MKNEFKELQEKKVQPLQEIIRKTPKEINCRIFECLEANRENILL